MLLLLLLYWLLLLRLWLQMETTLPTSKRRVVLLWWLRLLRLLQKHSRHPVSASSLKALMLSLAVVALAFSATPSTRKQGWRWYWWLLSLLRQQVWRLMLRQMLLRRLRGRCRWLRRWWWWGLLGKVVLYLA